MLNWELDVLKRKILVLCGSQKDLDNNGKPNALVELLRESIDEWNKKSRLFSLEVSLRVCSADRTPFLLPSIINEQEVDGIIYLGAYSLFLGASIQEALRQLRSKDGIRNFTNEFTTFMEKTEGINEYIPGRFAPSLVHREVSKYYSSNRYIPTVAVPCVDTPSQGQSAFISVVESSAGSEPKPVVGVKRVDTAIQYLGQSFLFKQDTSRAQVLFIYEEGCSESKEGAHAVQRRLLSFAPVRTQILSHQVLLEKDPEIEQSTLVCFVGSVSNKGLWMLKDLDQRFDFLLFCPIKTKMQLLWPHYIEQSKELDSTIHIGVGNYTNAAILLTRLIDQKALSEGMWKFRNQKTNMSVMELQPWIHSFSEVHV